MNNIVKCLVLFSVFTQNVLGLKILVLFPLPARSHYNLGVQLAKGLTQFGHEVTIVAAFSEPKPPKGFKEIYLPELVEMRENSDNEMGKVNMFEMENINPIFQVLFLNHAGALWTDLVFNHTKVQALLKSNEHFDVVILEQFLNDAHKYFAYHFNAPLVLFSTVGANAWVNNFVGNPEPASYIPNVFLSYYQEMTFLERMWNFIFGIIFELNSQLYFYPKQNEILHKYIPDAPHINELNYNISLLLLNSHESINQAVPNVPNMVNIGGYHVDPPKELPRDLKEFMDNAKDGVIYFSMGSNLVPSMMPKDKKEAIMKVLGSRKEKVLWKWDDKNLKVPSNFFVSNWFPQQAILSHPNCKLFITHGGLLSTTETVYLGVPVLAFPIFGDQKLNAARASSLGFGKSLPFSTINEHNLAGTLNELLENPKYHQNAKIRSQLLHDRPVKPIDLANYWIEYVVRYKGANHLRVAAVNLPFYKYHMLDVIGAVLGGLVLIAYLLSKLCCRRKASAKSQSKEKGE
uniref:UDP-glucuronosyltransferase n=1 Tax=Lissorhoptrus oryzophilus TaxID=308863 RepID=A0A2R4FXH0_9CUCU|nr:UDP-glucuronosyltransferase 40AB1 [Lissorhoptrus oryzophilus]